MCFVLPVCAIAAMMLFRKRALGIVLGGVLQVEGLVLIPSVAAGFSAQPMFGAPLDVGNTTQYSRVTLVFLLVAGVFFRQVEVVERGPDAEREYRIRVSRKRCCECGRKYKPEPSAKKHQNTCGEACRLKRRARLARKRYREAGLLRVRPYAGASAGRAAGSEEVLCRRARVCRAGDHAGDPLAPGCVA